MTKGRCVVFSGGCFYPCEYLRKVAAEAAYIICADGGARHARNLGLIPDLVLGDFDTLTSDELAELSGLGVELIRYPADKDYTDTHLALRKALELGFTEIELLAALGGRLDHTLANLMLLAIPQGEKARIRILDGQHEVFLIKKDGIISGECGDTVSLLPFGGEVTGISTFGLRYQVPGGVFTLGTPIGVSNRLSQKEARVAVGEGLLLVIRIIGERSETAK